MLASFCVCGGGGLKVEGVFFTPQCTILVLSHLRGPMSDGMDTGLGVG